MTMPEANKFSFHVDGSLPASGDVWVFGSNLAGRHGAGAAKVAREAFGAQPGVGAGPTGQCYAIPTKDGRNGADLKDPVQTLPIHEVRAHVAAFLGYAKAHPELRFFVTRVGCGRAGWTDAEMAPLFRGAPSNCSFATEWQSNLSTTAATTPARFRPR